MIDPGRLAWLERRRRGIGGTDVAAIMGCSPWASPWSVWAEKVGLADLEDDPTAEMRFGRDLEPIIAAWFTRETGLCLAGEQMMITHASRPFFATVDGLVVEAEASSVGDALGVFESKYTSDGRWAEIPEHYRLQVQWAMYCAGLDRAWLVVLHLRWGRPDFQIYPVERDEELLASVVPAVQRFWDAHVVTGRPPSPDGHPATTAALSAAWAAPVGDPAVDVAPLAALVEELAEFRAARARLEADIKAHENALRLALGNHTEGHIDGRLAVSWRPQPRTDIDRKRLREDHGDAYDRVSTIRVLRLHGSRPA